MQPLLEGQNKVTPVEAAVVQQKSPPIPVGLWPYLLQWCDDGDYDNDDDDNYDDNDDYYDNNDDELKVNASLMFYVLST